MTEKRFVAIDDEELYYITDTKDLKTLDDYIKEFSKAEYEFNKEEVLSVAKEEYWQMIYENSMSATENINWLNNLYNENEQLKHDASVLIQANIDYRKENKQLKQDNKILIKLLENQSMIIQELRSKILEYQLKEPIVLTKEDLEIMGKAVSYYTHGRCPE